MHLAQDPRSGIPREQTGIDTSRIPREQTGIDTPQHTKAVLPAPLLCAKSTAADFDSSSIYRQQLGVLFWGVWVG